MFFPNSTFISDVHPSKAPKPSDSTESKTIIVVNGVVSIKEYFPMCVTLSPKIAFVIASL